MEQNFLNNNPIPPIQPPPSVPTYRSFRWLVMMAVVSVIAVGGYAGAAYYLTYYHNTPTWPFGDLLTPIPTPTPAPAMIDPTAGWKTYTNIEYGFEFKYPVDWQIYANPPVIDYDTDYGTIYNEKVVIYGPERMFIVGIFNEVPSFSAELISRQGPNLKEIVVAGKARKADIYKGESDFLNSGEKCYEQCSTFKIMFEYQSRWFELQGHGYVGNLDGNIYNQILSTFRFIPSTSSGQVSLDASKEVLISLAGAFEVGNLEEIYKYFEDNEINKEALRNMDDQTRKDFASDLRNARLKTENQNTAIYEIPYLKNNQTIWLEISLYKDPSGRWIIFQW